MSSEIRIALTAVVLVAACGLTSAYRVIGGEPDGSVASSQQIADFTLPDYHGQEVALSDFADRRAIVVCFLGTDCPLAQFYGPRLQEMSAAFAGQRVAFIGINSNVQDSLSEMAGYARRHGIEFPLLKDLRHQVAAQFGATRTPEVFVLDQDRALRYQGRVDDQYTFGAGVGLAQPNETRADLRIALQEVLAGKKVSVPRTTAKGCLIGRVRKPSEQPEFTYSQHVSRLIQKHCLKCHREGQIGPFTLDSYAEVAGWGEMIAEVVREQRMPPWHAGEKSTARFLNDARLTDEEKRIFYRWVEDGCPEGDPADLPPPRTFPHGWFTEGGFDDVLYIAENPVPVKATGIEQYRYYELPGFDEDRWVKTIECLPGNHAVVHHIILYARPPGGEPIKPGSVGVSTQHFHWLAGFAPGTRPQEMPAGWARLIPAGYSLVFEMHYTPIGTAQTDRSGVGVVFAQRDQVRRVLYTSSALNSDFVIPPHDANYAVEADLRFSHDTQLLALFPHMHVRGRSFRYVLQPPGGSPQILLDVPSYDFNWQNSYTLLEPLPVRRGSRLHVTAHFDNSDTNPANPDPEKAVKWGPQSWDEMMIGFFDHGVTVQQARQLLEQQARKLEQQRAKQRRPTR